MQKQIAPGTVRITKALKVVEKTARSWKKSKSNLPNAIQAVKLFKARRKFSKLLSKDGLFLKGQLSPEGLCQGARITVTPDGHTIDKAYSLFASHLTFHDESSHDHWDVLFQNPGGTWAYAYTLDKKNQHVKKKYKKVQEFEKHYPKLKKNVRKAIHNESDLLALPMYTLLKTCMRVGSEIYFKAHGHKGLTTLTKKDIKISDDTASFKYLSKGGVPRNIIERFPQAYLERLSGVLAATSPRSFVFTNSHGHPLTDVHFKHAFKKYCGHEFYPHIVRSYYATARVKEFLQGRKRASKEEVSDLYTSIAQKLGHRKFDKKTNAWKESYNITMNYYIQPEVLDKVKRITV